MLDDRVYLDADKTPESFFDAPPVTEPEPVEESPPAPEPVPDAPPATKPEPAEAPPPAPESVPDAPPVTEPEPVEESPPAPEPVPDAPPATEPEPAEAPPPTPEPVPDAPPATEPEPAEAPPPTPEPVPDTPPAIEPVPAEEPPPEPAPDAPVPPPAESPSAPRDDRFGEETPPAAEMPRSEDSAGPVEQAPASEPDAGTDAAAGTTERRVASPRRTLRMPPATRPSSREFGYVDAMSLSYERGGSGVMLEGSVEVGTRYRLLARIGAAAEYQELLLGASWYATPPVADRLTLVLTFGAETGRFELESEGTDSRLSDTGLYFGGAARLVVNGRLELQAGLGHGSFFESEPVAFGGAAFHATSWLDLVSRVEFGGNDTLGVGLRFYY